MLTNLDEVFQSPAQPEQEKALDPTSIEAIAQHERDRLAALRASKQESKEDISEAAAEASGEAQNEENQLKEGPENVSVSTPETGAVKLAELAAEAAKEADTPEGEASLHKLHKAPPA